MTPARRRSLATVVTYASVAVVYLAIWTAVAGSAASRGPAGADLDRRGGQVLIAVSMLDCAGSLVAMPLLALGRGSRTPRVVTAAVILTTTGLVAALAVHSDRVESADAVAARLLLLATAAAAFSAARLSRALCRDVYDAAGLVYGALLLAAGGVVFAAPLLVRVPESGAVIPALLLANPFVTTASATSFDVLRTEALYRATPIGQRLFEYPAWYVATGVYAAVAAICSTASVFVIRSREARCV